MYSALRGRYVDRDKRHTKITDIVTGNFNVFDPDEENIESRSPNLVQVALEDTAEAASLVPTTRIQPARKNQAAKAEAARMERVATGFLDISRIDNLITETVMDMAAYGYGVWIVWPDASQKLPVIEKRDPRTCYPEPGYRPGDTVQRCIFANEVFYSQLPPEYQEKAKNFATQDTQSYVVQDENTKFVLCEYFDREEYVMALLYEHTPSFSTSTTAGSRYTPIELERIPNRHDLCPVVIGSRFTLDGEFRGQFDQIIGVLEAHVRLMGLLLDYADQAVYSDIWVKDLIGELSWGGHGYIELGPNGAIGRVPPAVTTLTVFDNLDRLVDSIHVGGRWPKSRPGEIDQAIASAKFIEATAGMMNTAIKTYHQLLKRMIEQALRLAFTVDKAWFPGTKTISGILRNQEFIEEYDPAKDINLDHKVRVEYGLGLGHDPASSAVLMIQYAQNDYISREFVQENIEGLTDVAREQERLDVQKFKDMALAKLVMGLEAGEVPDRALIDMAEARMKGDDLFALYRKYIVDPKEQMQAQALPSGLGQPPALPGPVGPDGLPAQLPSGPGGPEMAAPTPPPPPDVSQLLSRLSVPLPGGGGLIGSEVRG